LAILDYEALDISSAHRDFEVIFGSSEISGRFLTIFVAPRHVPGPITTARTFHMATLRKKLVLLGFVAAFGSPFAALADPITGVEANAAGYTLNPAGGSVSGSQGSQAEIPGNTTATANLNQSFDHNGSSASVNQTVTAQIGQLSGTVTATATALNNGAYSDVDSGVGGQPGGAAFWDSLTFYNPGVTLGTTLAITLDETVNWAPGASISGNANGDFPAATVQGNALMELLDSTGSASLGQIGGFTSTFEQFPGSPSTTLDHLGGSLTLDVSNGSTEVLYGFLENGASTEVVDNDGTATTSAFDSIDVSYFVDAGTSGTTVTSASGHDYGVSVPDSGLGIALVALVFLGFCTLARSGAGRRLRAAPGVQS
jgi:hypothetical protein